MPTDFLEFLFDLDINADEERRDFCIYWLERPRGLIESMQDTDMFSEDKLMWLIKAELKYYKRVDILNRLTARLNKLRRKREWRFIKEVRSGKIVFN